LLLNCAFAGNIPTIQSKNYKQKQKVINLYEQIHEFLLYQYTIANNQNKIIIKKILNLPIEKLIIKAFPFENKISFFDKDKENFISFENQSDLIKKIISDDQYENIVQNNRISRGPIITGITIMVIGYVLCKVIDWGWEECHVDTHLSNTANNIVCKITRTWQEIKEIGPASAPDPANPDTPSPGSEVPTPPWHTPIYRFAY